MKNILKDKTILITGGTGSFGTMFTEIVLNEFEPEAIRIFSRGEKKQLDMMNRFGDDDRLRFFIGDVRDHDRLYRAMNDVDIVVHAAALKQVPACEYNPIEAIRTNVDGSINVIDAAIDCDVDRVIAISTDKAVHPVNLYGATKMTMEKLFVQGNSYTGFGKTRFGCVRYGNVIGSRGSVIPLFIKQRDEGVLTLTDKEMTRFWITLKDGVRFVIDCISRLKGGEIFVPKIPSMKIFDVAQAIAPESKINIVGIRPGEKIHEVLLTEDEARHAYELDDFFVIEPEFSFWTKNNGYNGTNIPNNYQYASNLNDNWISKEKLRKMIKEGYDGERIFVTY